ncbi:ImmA/IrrE family metallo-endopeptidase [Pseudomonas extremaustralis]|uniref:ImmA/IrrE family metallo-endopeptidase n=1 Tax=Pseudomonas extremaustralis TaxID=359110 RepID=UPI002AA86F2F|nr:ImmA/IrrE family metallo-endopeptidase [Pseudomonas extremaustralis]
MTRPSAAVAAKQLLDRAWEGRGFPVDPVQIAKILGIDVMTAELPDRVAGAIIKEVDSDPVILLHEADSAPRQRFTCAHELGHYIYRQEDDGEQYEYVELRGDHSRSGQNAEEVYANQFAANLLMPSEAVRSLFREQPSRAVLALTFGVSDDAMRYRLKNLKLAG